ncbi:hypothetical protein [Alteromonas gracilis]|uniref:hypothetical protein n=1 Tax=Alteromonas gracilis TaxID=1479524 RepID=UPI0037360E80
MKSSTIKQRKLIGLVAIGLVAIGYIIMTTPSHNYDVDSSLIVQPSNYESCIKASYGVVDDSNEAERKEDARACLEALEYKNFFVDVDGKALIFINSNEYYRIAPEVIEKFKAKSSALIEGNPILPNNEAELSGT